MNEEKLYLLDWGEKCNGARYAIVQSKPEELFWSIDMVGDPSGVKFAEIANSYDERLYVELPGIEIKDETGKDYTEISAGPGMNCINLGCVSKLEWEDFLAA